METSKGGTLKQARTLVRTCAVHGDFIGTGCAECGTTGTFKGYTPDSVAVTLQQMVQRGAAARRLLKALRAGAR